MSTVPTVTADLQQPLVGLLLSIADDKLFLGHRNGDWTGLGPFLEEDIAFSNIAQDEIAHAQELYRLAARFTDPGALADVEANRLAFDRPAEQRLNAALVEMPDQFDWALAIVRQCFYDHFDLVRLPRLQQSAYKPLAQLAGKMMQEVTFHADHFDAWIRKLGRGTDESRDRLQQAVETLWPAAMGLFEAVADQARLVEAGLYPGDEMQMQQAWTVNLGSVLAAGNVAAPPLCPAASPSGRLGHHTPALDDLLADLSEVFRSEPGAAW